MKVLMVSQVISIYGLHLSKYISFTLLVNSAWLNIADVDVADPMLPVLVCLIVYFLIALEMSSTAVTTFGGNFIDGGQLLDLFQD